MRKKKEWLCIDCGKPREDGPQTRRCNSCFKRRCEEVYIYPVTTGASRAISVVKLMKLADQLPELNGSIPCDDCRSEPATLWEHRDYNYPMWVAPVCATCNRLRGHAVPWRGKPKVKNPIKTRGRLKADK